MPSWPYIGLNIQTSFLTPPFGFALFYLRGVADKVVKTVSIYKGVVPFIGLQILALVITGFFPSLVNYLPNRTYLTSESAPPPMNPRIQPCLEDQVFSVYASQKTSLLAAIDTMATIDASYVSSAAMQVLQDSLAKARKTFVKVDAIYLAQAKLTSFEQSYAPLHQSVREIELQVRSNERLIEEAKLRLRRLDDTPLNANRRSDLATRIKQLGQLNSRLVKNIDPSWATQRPIFDKLNKAQKQARNDYRRNADEAYEGIVQLRLWISQAPQLLQAQSGVEQLDYAIGQLDAKEAMEAIKHQEKYLAEFAGVSAIKSKLSKARRALKGSQYNPAKAKAFHAEAMELLIEEIRWRKRASQQMYMALNDYDLTIRDSIGLRLQERMSDDVATAIAACMSGHNNISLQF